MSFAAQKDAHAPIPVARIRRGDPPHRIERRRVALGTQQTVLQDRAGQFDQLASLALGMPSFRQSHLVPSGFLCKPVLFSCGLLTISGPTSA
jgi:hypothetical protein